MVPDPRQSKDEIGALVDAARAGDHSAWAHLHDLYRPYLLLICARVPAEMRPRFDGEDIVQSTFLAAFQQLASFQYRGEPGFRGWLKEIATHQLLDRIKSNDRGKRAVDREQRMEAPELFVNQNSESETPSRILSLAESQSKVLSSIARMPQEQQELVWMREFEHRTFAEIAKSLGQPESTVRRRHKESIEALLRLLD